MLSAQLRGSLKQEGHLNSGPQGQPEPHSLCLNFFSSSFYKPQSDVSGEISQKGNEWMKYDFCSGLHRDRVKEAQGGECPSKLDFLGKRSSQRVSVVRYKLSNPANETV